MADIVHTGGYIWASASRMKGDPNRVAGALARIRDRHDRVDVDTIKDAWKRNDPVLRETMGDEAHVLDVGLDEQAYKILRSLEYEAVDLRTEETQPGGRVYRTLREVTNDPSATPRVFVATPIEAVSLHHLNRGAWGTQPPTTPPEPLPPDTPRVAPVFVNGTGDVVQRPAIVPDRDMEAWLALSRWRERYGDIPRYAPIVAAMDTLD